MHVLHVVGARPNFMKAAPVMRALARRGGIRQTLVHTGQHYDANMSEAFFRQLDIPQPDINLEVGSGSHAWQTAQIMSRFEAVVLEHRPDLVLVYGDVNSTLAAALVCVKLLIPVGHVEAGLRSFDRTMPEEFNRLLTDQIADLLFTPSADADENLLREGIPPKRIHRVGNVMIDTLAHLLPKTENSPILAQLGLVMEQRSRGAEVMSGAKEQEQGSEGAEVLSGAKEQERGSEGAEVLSGAKEQEQGSRSPERSEGTGAGGQGSKGAEVRGRSHPVTPSPPLLVTGGTSAQYVLVTLHRPSNVDGPETLRRVMSTLADISRDLPVIFPVHPRTRQRLEETRYPTSNLALSAVEGEAEGTQLRLIEPLGYLDFLALQRHATLVITDSGGIQEETTYLGVPCLTVRENTERPVTVTLGTNTLVGQNMDRLRAEVARILAGDGKRGQVPPLWDGHAAERIADVIENLSF